MSFMDWAIITVVFWFCTMSAGVVGGFVGCFLFYNTLVHQESNTTTTPTKCVSS